MKEELGGVIGRNKNGFFCESLITAPRANPPNSPVPEPPTPGQEASGWKRVNKELNSGGLLPRSQKTSAFFFLKNKRLMLCFSLNYMKITSCICV